MKPSASVERGKTQSSKPNVVSAELLERVQQERDQMISVRECAALLRLSEVSIRRYLWKGKLRRFKVGNGRGGRTLISLRDALALIREA